ncbi:MAG: hypothetical protein R6X34_28460 [Chloroflexota bacterium]
MFPKLKLRPLLFLLLLLGLTLVLPAVAQENNGLTMTAQAGYDGYYKANAWMPVVVTVANQGAAVEGELRIIQGSTTSNDRVIYNSPISLPTQSDKRVFLYVYPVDFSTVVNVELLDANGRSLLKTTSDPIRQLAQDSLLTAVVTPNPGNLDLLEDVTGGRSDGAVAYLDLDDLPDMPSAWNGLDVLIFHDVDTGQLSAEQRAALTGWLNTGGQLVVVGGPGWQKTAVPLADLLPVTVTGSETVDDLPALLAAAGEPFRDPGPYLVTTSSLTHGELLLHENGLPLLAQRPFGRGAVTFLALDPSLAPLLDWRGSEAVWAEVADRIPLPAAWSTGFRNNWAAVSAVSSLPALSMPPVFQLAFYLLLYILVVGPLNYIILKRKNRRELAWVTIPVTVLLFSALAYLTGFQLKGNDTIINQMSVATGEVGSEEMRVNTLLGLYSPRRRSYDVALPAGSLARPLVEPYSSNRSGLTAVTQGSNVVLTDVRVDVSDVETFIADSIQPAPALSGEASLRTRDGDIELTATIRNNSEQHLELAALLIGSTAIELGDLAPGAETTVTEIVGSAGSSSAAPFGGPSYGYGSPLMANAALILGTANYYDDREAYPRWQLLQALEDEYLAGGQLAAPNQATLLAWSDASQLGVSVAEGANISASTTLYLLEMPLQNDLQSGSLTLPLSLLNWTILGNMDLYTDTMRDLYMTPGSWVEVEFMPWPELQRLAVEDLALQLLPVNGQTAQPVPTVRLWDWQTEAWVDMVDGGWGETAVSDPQRFLTTDNVIRLRLQNNSSAYTEVQEFYPLLTGELE